MQISRIPTQQATHTHWRRKQESGTCSMRDAARSMVTPGDNREDTAIPRRKLRFETKLVVESNRSGLQNTGVITSNFFRANTVT
eukprot:876341-Rhodomonas_salina.1